MPDLFRNKYRIPSARLQTWDYASNGMYFVTICTQNREHHFGQISEGKMVLNDIGNYAHQYWQNIPEQFKHVELGVFVIMPNHMHGIIIIDKPINHVQTRFIASPSNDIASIPEQTTNNRGGITGDKNPMLYDNLSAIIRWYKGRTAYDAHKTNPDFAWQTRFHEHIIRSQDDFTRISNYIIDNPLNWGKDDFNTP